MDTKENIQKGVVTSQQRERHRLPCGVPLLVVFVVQVLAVAATFVGLLVQFSLTQEAQLRGVIYRELRTVQQKASLAIQHQLAATESFALLEAEKMQQTNAYYGDSAFASGNPPLAGNTRYFSAKRRPSDAANGYLFPHEYTDYRALFAARNASAVREVLLGGLGWAAADVDLLCFHPTDTARNLTAIGATYFYAGASAGVNANGTKLLEAMAVGAHLADVRAAVDAMQPLANDLAAYLTTSDTALYTGLLQRMNLQVDNTGRPHYQLFSFQPDTLFTIMPPLSAVFVSPDQIPLMVNGQQLPPREEMALLPSQTLLLESTTASVSALLAQSRDRESWEMRSPAVPLWREPLFFAQDNNFNSFSLFAVFMSPVDVTVIPLTTPGIPPAMAAAYSTVVEARASIMIAVDLSFMAPIVAATAAADSSVTALVDVATRRYLGGKTPFDATGLRNRTLYVNATPSRRFNRIAALLDARCPARPVQDLLGTLDVFGINASALSPTRVAASGGVPPPPGTVIGINEALRSVGKAPFAKGSADGAANTRWYEAHRAQHCLDTVFEVTLDDDEDDEGGGEFVVSAARLVTPHGMDLLLMQYTPSTVFFEVIDTNRKNSIGIAVVATAIVGISSLFVLLMIRRPLSILHTALSLAAGMHNAEVEAQFQVREDGNKGECASTGSGSKGGGHRLRWSTDGTCRAFLLSEMRDLLDAFLSMNHRLLLARPYLPQCLLVSSDDSINISEGGLYEEGADDEELDEGEFDRHSDHNSRVTGAHSSVSSGTGTPTSTLLAAGAGRRRYSGVMHRVVGGGSSDSSTTEAMERRATAEVAGLNSKIDRGLMTRRVAVLVVNGRNFLQTAEIAHHGGHRGAPIGESLASRLAALTEAVLAAAAAERGVVDHFHGDHFYVSFNAVRLVATPARNAAICALALQDACVAATSAATPSTAASANGATMGIAANRCTVGNFGTSAMMKFCAVGPAYAAASYLELYAQRNAEALFPAAPARGGALVGGASALRDVELAVAYGVVGWAVLANREGAVPVPVAVLAAPKSALLKQADEWLYEVDAGQRHNPLAAPNALVEALLRELTAAGSLSTNRSLSPTTTMSTKQRAKPIPHAEGPLIALIMQHILRERAHASPSPQSSATPLDIGASTQNGGPSVLSLNEVRCFANPSPTLPTMRSSVGGASPHEIAWLPSTPQLTEAAKAAKPQVIFGGGGGGGGGDSSQRNTNSAARSTTALATTSILNTEQQPVSNPVEVFLLELLSEAAYVSSNCMSHYPDQSNGRGDENNGDSGEGFEESARTPTTTTLMTPLPHPSAMREDPSPFSPHHDSEAEDDQTSAHKNSSRTDDKIRVVSEQMRKQGCEIDPSEHAANTITSAEVRVTEDDSRQSRTNARGIGTARGGGGTRETRRTPLSPPPGADGPLRINTNLSFTSSSLPSGDPQEQHQQQEPLSPSAGAYPAEAIETPFSTTTYARPMPPTATSHAKNAAQVCSSQRHHTYQMDDAKGTIGYGRGSSNGKMETPTRVPSGVAKKASHFSTTGDGGQLRCRPAPSSLAAGPQQRVEEVVGMVRSRLVLTLLAAIHQEQHQQPIRTPALLSRSPHRPPLAPSTDGTVVGSVNPPTAVPGAAAAAGTGRSSFEDINYMCVMRDSLRLSALY